MAAAMSMVVAVATVPQLVVTLQHATGVPWHRHRCLAAEPWWPQVQWLALVPLSQIGRCLLLASLLALLAAVELCGVQAVALRACAVHCHAAPLPCPLAAVALLQRSLRSALHSVADSETAGSWSVKQA